MATQVTAWKSSDGKLHRSQGAAIWADELARRNALAREPAAVVARLTSDLVEGLTTPDGYACSHKDDLLDPHCQDIILELAAAITALRSLEETT